eukprot:CAMPEP_0198512478 /NCGR_PEP_ID=MMETSP1462-20131121/15472_1 /TAXON_ID=1333877 /ORGANISM="Brandtodinium nutriculum, Strain RCC3387" /LENGTH=274 /DNA_ID=CAMNT_0044241885 /DNA_START=11 /DNA_END=836 /DNA_ORIENTATION=+
MGHRTAVGSALGRVVISPDLVLDAAPVSDLHDGPAAAARARPRDDARAVDAAAAHRRAEHAGPAAEELRLAAAGEPAVPPGAVARGGREATLQAAAVAMVAHEVDVKLVHRAMAWRIHDQGATRVGAVPPGRRKARVVVPDVAGVDVLDARARAPDLVTARVPAAVAASATKGASSSSPTSGAGAASRPSPAPSPTSGAEAAEPSTSAGSSTFRAPLSCSALNAQASSSAAHSSSCAMASVGSGAGEFVAAAATTPAITKSLVKPAINDAFGYE